MSRVAELPSGGAEVWTRVYLTPKPLNFLPHGWGMASPTGDPDLEPPGLLLNPVPQRQPIHQDEIPAAAPSAASMSLCPSTFNYYGL